MSISSSRAALLSRSTASSNCKAVTLAASDRELDVPGKGGEPAVSGGKGGEPAVSGGKGGEGWCHSSMPTRIDTLLSNPLHPHVWKDIRHGARRGYNASVGARKPCRYHRVHCRQLHVYTYIHVHVSI